MIIEKVVGNVATLAKRAPHIERVYMESDDLVKRIQRVVTDHGKELGIRLKENRELIDGDVDCRFGKRRRYSNHYANIHSTNG
jgi:urease accessory protein